MPEALRELRDRAIADIERQPTKWQGYYLPKLRQFVTQVDNLPDDHINYPYRSIVVGSRATDDTSAKAGIINRFLAQMQERVKVLPGQNSATPAIAQSEKVITGEIVTTSSEAPLARYTNGTESTEQNLEDVVTKLERLVKLREQGILSGVEFEAAKKKILNS
jgi:hypothetical protein